MFDGKQMSAAFYTSFSPVAYIIKVPECTCTLLSSLSQHSAILIVTAD